MIVLNSRRRKLIENGFYTVFQLSLKPPKRLLSIWRARVSINSYEYIYLPVMCNFLGLPKCLCFVDLKKYMHSVTALMDSISTEIVIIVNCSMNVAPVFMEYFAYVLRFHNHHP